MDESSLWLALVFIFATGALGIYLLLPAEHPFTASAVRWFGAPLAVISLVLLSVLVGMRVGWWPEIPEGDEVFPVAFALPAIVSIAAAVMAITARTATTSVLWFGGLLLSNSVIFLLHGAYVLALATWVVLVIAAAAGRLLVRIQLRQLNDRAKDDSPSSHEPFLACLAGGLFAALLVGSIWGATAGLGIRDVDGLAKQMSRKRDAVLGARGQSTSEDWIQPGQPHLNSFGRAMFHDHRVATWSAVCVFVVSLAAVPLIAGRTERPPKFSGVTANGGGHPNLRQDS